MPIQIASRRLSEVRLRRRFGDALILDVTSRGPEPWVRFSPFFAHGGIPIPFTPGSFGASVEGIWQGLKVFETSDVDTKTIENTTMRGMKRTVSKFGKVLGHREGVCGTRLLSYEDARKQIYIPTYEWVLENRLHEELEQLYSLANTQNVVLLDYETNTNAENLSRPLSHAGVIREYCS
ncbi:hypothetical protein CCAX7_12530 [Capsulimonas corticalis]|uniref:Uncharacterized protein n=1 Tax=Capsulimonas corticalis TaxID=2219043 RepID=A0A402D4C7_9BACT|nr:hypothetical protein [Capsulimonas corticalis]BDI29202.1 hypothetical protein CCAX7_12530 [Capsulimonas corticalis]